MYCPGEKVRGARVVTGLAVGPGRSGGKRGRRKRTWDNLPLVKNINSLNMYIV